MTELQMIYKASYEILLKMAAESTKETVNTFVELVSRVIEKSPKIGYAVLLLHTGVISSPCARSITCTGPLLME